MLLVAWVVVIVGFVAPFGIILRRGWGYFLEAPLIGFYFLGQALIAFRAGLSREPLHTLQPIPYMDAVEPWLLALGGLVFVENCIRAGLKVDHERRERNAKVGLGNEAMVAPGMP